MPVHRRAEPPAPASPARPGRRAVLPGEAARRGGGAGERRRLAAALIGVVLLCGLLATLGGAAASGASNALTWGLPVRQYHPASTAQLPDPQPTVMTTGVSCAGAGCVGVDADGVLASSNPYSSGAAWTLTAVDVYPLDGVSCATVGSTTGCVAVDSAGNVFTSTDPFVATPTWTERTGESGVALLAVSCAAGGSAADCAALDANGDVVASTDAFAASPAWSNPIAADPGNMPDVTTCTATNCGFSCTSGGCVIADANGNLVGGDPFAPSPTWTSTPFAGVKGPGVMYGVSCFAASSGSDCVTVASGGDAVTSTDPYAGTPGWSVHAAVTAGASGVFPIGVACTIGGCDLVTNSGGSVLVASTPSGSPLTSSPWTQSSASGLQGDSFDGALSCTASGCVGGGYLGDMYAASSFPSTSWGTGEIVADGEYLGRMSCVATSASSVGCVAVDEAGNVLTSTDPFAGAPTWSLAHLEADPLNDVSCLQSGSTTQCAAVSNDGYLWTSTSPFAGAASAWTRKVTFDQSAGYGVTAISCLAVSGATDCELGDDQGTLASSTDVFSASTPTFSTSSYPGGTDVTGISCLPIGMTPACWATDDSSTEGEVLTADPFGASPSWGVVYTDSGSGFPSLGDIACVGLGGSNAGCVAGDSLGYVLSSASAGTSASWSASEVDTSASPGLTEVTCAAPPSAPGVTCALGDGNGDVVATATAFDTPDWAMTRVSGSALTSLSCVATSTTAVSCAGGSTDGWIATGATPTGSAPGPPAGVTASAPGNQSASVSWTAPSGSVTGYRVYAYPASQCGSSSCSGTATTSATVSAPSSSTTVDGLSNGTSYEFTVTASNGSGTSPPSTPSNAVTPRTAPAAPSITTATAGNQSVSLAWTAPNDGGSAIASYTIDVWAGAQCGSSSCTGSPVEQLAGLTATDDVVSPLTNGTAYAFTVFAANGVGPGLQSAPTVSLTPATLPGQPTNLQASPGNASVGLNWTAPPDNGSPLQRYTIDIFDCTGSSAGTCASTPSSTASAAGSATSATVNGLTNNRYYEFDLIAVNGVGSSPPSADSAVVQPAAPAQAPDAPTGVRASLPANPPGGELDVDWTASTTNGSPVIGYVVDAYLASQCSTSCTGSTVTSATVGSSTVSAALSGLSDGTSYAFAVVAESSAGNSPASSPSNAVVAATVPGAPTGVGASAGDESASVFWTAPASDGGDAIVSYTAEAYTAGECSTAANTCSGTPASSQTEAASSSYIPLRGLANGTLYYVVVFATSPAGSGSASTPLATVTPAAVPGPPTITGASAGDGSATLDWSAPASDGGSDVTSYIVDLYRAALCNPRCGGAPLRTAGASSATTTYTFDALPNGNSVVFTVAATSAAGTGSPAQSGSVTPSTVPGAPRSVTAQGLDLAALVSWNPPVSDGGATISGYTVDTYLAADCTTSCSGSPIERTPAGDSALSTTVADLSNGTSYAFTVAAANADGTGAASTPSDAATPEPVPSAPTGVSARAGDGQVVVTWTASVSNGSPVTGYVVRAYLATQCSGSCSGSAVTSVSAGAAASGATIGPLLDGTAYAVTVTATSAAGDSAASAASAPVTPSAPVETTTTAPGTTSATNPTTAPGSSGGGPGIASPPGTTGETATTATTTTVPKPQVRLVAVDGVRKHVATFDIACAVRACSGQLRLTVEEKVAVKVRVKVKVKVRVRVKGPPKGSRGHTRAKQRTEVRTRTVHRLEPVRIGTARYRLAPGRKRLVRVTLDRAGRRAYGKARRHRLRAQLLLSVAGGGNARDRVTLAPAKQSPGKKAKRSPGKAKRSPGKKAKQASR